MRRWLSALALLVGLAGPAHAQQPFPGGLWTAAPGWPAVINGPCEVTGNVTVSNGGLTMQGNNVGSVQIGAFGPAPPKQYYVEITMNSGASGDSTFFGVCKPAATAADLNSLWTNGIAWATTGFEVRNGSVIDSGIYTQSAGGVMQLAIDTEHYRFYARGAGGSDTFQTANPIFYPTLNNPTNYGYDFSVLSPTTIFDLALMFRASVTDKFTVNYGPSFAFVPPMGYAFGWNGTIPGSGSAFDAGTAIGSNIWGIGNFSFTATNNTASAARSVNSYSTGKRYVEFAASQLGSNDYFWGVSNGTISCSMPTTCAGVTAIGTSLGDVYNNSVGQIAIDTDNKLLWIRGRQTDNWNLNASANPATGVGGFSMSFGPPYYLTSQSPGGIGEDHFIISNPNYMTYAAPAGFTAGW